MGAHQNYFNTDLWPSKFSLEIPKVVAVEPPSDQLTATSLMHMDDFKKCKKSLQFYLAESRKSMLLKKLEKSPWENNRIGH